MNALMYAHTHNMFIMFLPHQSMYMHTIYVTGPGKTGFIYTEYTCSYYGTYFLFYMCYPKSVSFIVLLMDSAYMMTF